MAGRLPAFFINRQVDRTKTWAPRFTRSNRAACCYVERREPVLEAPAFSLMADRTRRAGIDTISRRTFALDRCNAAGRYERTRQDYQCRTRKQKRD
jgi:hypothetical protein